MREDSIKEVNWQRCCCITMVNLICRHLVYRWDYILVNEISNEEG